MIRNIYLLALVLAVWSCETAPIQKIDLSGEWQFKMDSLDLGVSEKWYTQNFEESVKLPGSMVENGKGNEITLNTKWTGGVRNPEWYKDPNYAPYHDPENIRFPYWLQPDKKYTGAAWYQKKVTIPKSWTEKVVWLNLERPHWESTVWINGQKVGTQNSMGVAHRFNIGDFLKPGENTISICIDNSTKGLDVGRNSHSITDHTQSNWNGIVGDISLQSLDKIYFGNIQVYPSRETNTVNIVAVVNNASSEETNVTIAVGAKLKSSAQGDASQKDFKFKIPAGEKTINLDYKMDDLAQNWDEFNPNVYQLAVDMIYANGQDNRYIDFGFRDFKADSSGLSINGRRVFLRGTLECAIFPKTGYPPTKAEGWEKVFTAVKAHGLNHVRFHSWCPPEAAFEVADKMGVYLQLEASSWANQSTQLGSGYPIDEYIYEESKRMVEAYGNHPSFVMMAYGNEPGGPKQVEYLTEFVNYWKATDSRRIYTSASGWPKLAVSDFHDLPAPRIQQWGERLRSVINGQAPRTNYDWTNKLPKDGIPVVSHEIGQWCVYPNFKEIKKYTGVLKAKNFELFEESLNAHNMGHLADSFLLASGKLQALCYKADIEAALRTPKFGGFQLLDLHDFPGQGTALVGVLDPFWEEKGYISPEEYRRFCNSTVPLARLAKRIFNEGDTLNAAIEVAHFGPVPLKAVNPEWTISEGEKIIAQGTFGLQTIPIGNGFALGEVAYTFQTQGKPRKLTLEVAVNEFANSWEVWVYPAPNSSESSDIRVVENIDPATIEYLEKGGKVLLSLGRGNVAPEMGGKVAVGFSSIFWNTAWTEAQPPHTLGLLCDPEHPALAQFPTEYHSNWQWWDAMSHCDAIQLDSFSTELKPIVRIIDDWVTNRRLAMLFEAKVGNGSILVSGVDLVNLDNRPEAIQLKESLLKYMDSSAFSPEVSLEASQITSILK